MRYTTVDLATSGVLVDAIFGRGIAVRYFSLIADAGVIVCFEDGEGNRSKTIALQSMAPAFSRNAENVHFLAAKNSPLKLRLSRDVVVVGLVSYDLVEREEEANEPIKALAACRRR